MKIIGKMGRPTVQENTVEVEHIQEMTVSSDVTNIDFSVHEEKHVHLVLETFEKGPDLGVQLINERLEINVELPRKKSIFKIKQQISKLTIYLPSDFAQYYQIHSSVGNISFSDLAFKQLQMKTGAGDVKVSSIEAENIIIESGAGNIKLKQVAAEELQVKSGAGNIKGNNCTGKLTVQSGAGNIDFHVDGQDDLTMKSGAGNIHVYLPDHSSLNATVQVSAGIGTVRTELPIGGEKTKKFSSVFGDGSNLFLITTGVGNISLYEES